MTCPNCGDTIYEECAHLFKSTGRFVCKRENWQKKAEQISSTVLLLRTQLAEAQDEIARLREEQRVMLEANGRLREALRNATDKLDVAARYLTTANEIILEDADGDDEDFDDASETIGEIEVAAADARRALEDDNE